MKHLSIQLKTAAIVLALACAAAGASFAQRSPSAKAGCRFPDGKTISVEPAGNYTLFAIPNPNAWTLIVNKTKAEDIGFMLYYPGRSSDLVRLPMTSSQLASKQEDFTISLELSGGACTMRFDWDMARASISISTRK